MYKRIFLGMQRLRPNGEISVEKKLCPMLYIGENKGSRNRRILLYSVGVLCVLSNHNKQLKKMNCKLFRTHLNLNIKHKVLPEFLCW